MEQMSQRQEDVVKDYHSELIQKLFYSFLDTFTLIEDDPNYEDYAGKQYAEGDEVKYYHIQAERIKENETTTMYIDFEHLGQFNSQDQTEDLPDDILANFYRFENNMTKALYNFMFKHHQEYAKDKNFFLGFYNLPNTYKLRDLKTNFIGRLMSISGTVTRTTEVRPEMLRGAFRDEESKTVYKDVEQQFKLTYPPVSEGAKRFEIVQEE